MALFCFIGLYERCHIYKHKLYAKSIWFISLYIVQNDKDKDGYLVIIK